MKGLMMATVTKWVKECPMGCGEADCDHLYECPECGASELAGETHDTSCVMGGAEQQENDDDN